MPARTLLIAVGAALVSAALWYAALALALNTATWLAVGLALASAILTFFAVARDTARR